MRSIAVFVLVCSVLTAVVKSDRHVNIDDDTYLSRQKILVELVKHISQNNLNPEYRTIADSYVIEENLDHYNNVATVQKFIDLYKSGVLIPRNTIFSILDEEHRQQAIALFNVFYNAKDWDTLYKTLVWAKVNLNGFLFGYTFFTVKYHHKDLDSLMLPPIYETIPFYFFNADVIRIAQSIKMENFRDVASGATFVLNANRSRIPAENLDEELLNYFTEDIGLNSFYQDVNSQYPFWMGKEYFPGQNRDGEGEWYLYQHQQILARYYMERLSNGLGEIPDYSIYKPIKSGYKPMLRYYNGKYFAQRPNNYMLSNNDQYYDVYPLRIWERRIRDVIDQGFISMPDGSHFNLSKPSAIDLLGNFIQGNPDSPIHPFTDNIEITSRRIFGATVPANANQIIPSAIELSLTAMRDPIFYQMWKRIISYYWSFKSHLPSYEKKDLWFEGVNIESVNIGKLLTHYEEIEVNINNALDISPTEKENRYFSVRQMRLTHEHFHVSLNVKSNKAQAAMVKIFMGPKYDEYGRKMDMNEQSKHFFELDYFKVDLSAGENQVLRKCTDFKMFAVDHITTKLELYQKVMMSHKGERKFTITRNNGHCGFPFSLILPKGTTDGWPVQFYFIVLPYRPVKVDKLTKVDESDDQTNETGSCGVKARGQYYDNLALGFPFDRIIHQNQWFTPNMIYADAHIFHKTKQ